MKILWCKLDTSHRVAGHYNHFLEAFQKIADVTVHIQSLEGQHPAHFQKYCLEERDTPFNDVSLYQGYDFVIIFNPFVFGNEEWDKVDCPKAVVLEDQHGDNNRWQIEFARRNDMLLLHRYQLKDFNKDIVDKVTNNLWFPHSVNTEMFKNYKLSKIYDLLQVGAMWEGYETRHKIQQAVQKVKWDRYRFIPRPMEGVEDKWPIGEDYAREINKAWFTVCCGSRLEYTVMKYFEIPAAGSIIYGDLFPEAERLGFRDGVNMVIADPDNPMAHVKNFIDNRRDQVIEMMHNGQQLIQEKFTNEVRALELLEIMKGLVK